MISIHNNKGSPDGLSQEWSISIIVGKIDIMGI